MPNLRRLLVLAALPLVGCSGEEAREAVATATRPTETAVALSGKAVRTEGIALSWEGNNVHVGDAWESAQRLFPERRSAYRLRSLPDRFGAAFDAHGWETNEGQGYGVITNKDLVVAAIYHAEDVEDQYAQDLRAAQRAGSGALEMHEVRNGKLDWSYWESGTQRLMVLLAKGDKGTDVTLLMGDTKVLDALGATKPVDAAGTSTAPFLTQPLSPGESGGGEKIPSTGSQTLRERSYLYPEKG